MASIPYGAIISNRATQRCPIALLTGGPRPFHILARLDGWARDETSTAQPVLGFRNRFGTFIGVAQCDPQTVMRHGKAVVVDVAAAALEHGLNAVTRNTGPFDPTGVPTPNPFLPPRQGMHR